MARKGMERGERITLLTDLWVYWYGEAFGLLLCRICWSSHGIYETNGMTKGVCGTSQTRRFLRPLIELVAYHEYSNL